MQAASEIARALRLIRAGALVEAEAKLRGVLETEPGHADALVNLGTLVASRGDFVEASEIYEKALRHKPDDRRVRDNLAEAHLQAGKKFWEQGKLGLALERCRTAIEFRPDDISTRNILMHVLAASGEPARLTDYAADLAPGDIAQRIFVACMPKSGSTFLNLTLSVLTGWRETFLTFAFLQNEEEIYLPNLVAAARQNTVTQQHCRATEPNIQLLQAFDIRPVIQVRNLFDVVVSYTDFYDGGATFNSFFRGRWEGLDRPRRFDLIIDNWMPWYLSFYASWMDVSSSGRLDCHIVHYEDLHRDKPSVLKAIADFYDLGKSPAECQAAVDLIDSDRGQTRYNKGVIGRGTTELNDAQKARIRDLASYYPDIDFGPIGL